MVKRKRTGKLPGLQRSKPVYKIKMTRRGRTWFYPKTYKTRQGAENLIKRFQKDNRKPIMNYGQSIGTYDSILGKTKCEIIEA